MPDLSGCPGCQKTFERLDALLEAAANFEVEVAHHDKNESKLHVMSAVESWWLDRTLKLFPTRAKGVDAANNCIVACFREQGIMR